MNPNPHQPGSTSVAASRSRATYWMVWTGVIVLMLAVICLLATFVGVIGTFGTIATSGATPNPADLANGISNSLILFIVAALIAVVGIVLLILGFIRRRPVAET